MGSSIAFPSYLNPVTGQKAELALALFREGRTVNSIPFAFLSYFKILNIFWNDKQVTVNGQKQNPIVEGIRATLPKIKKDESLLRRLSALRATKPDVPIYLYNSRRCAIAHAHAYPIVDPDDISDIRRLSEDLHIVKAIAEYLIEEELKVPRWIMDF